MKKQLTNPYLKACALLSLTPRPELTDLSNSDLVSEDAYHRLIICIRAKNMIRGKVWIPVYNGTEWHYFPRWKKDTAGFGFPDVDCVGWDSLTNVGERLEYRTYELMMQGVKEFKPYYDAYFMPYQPAA